MLEISIILICVTGVILHLLYKSTKRDKSLIQKSKARGVISKHQFINDLEEKGYERKWIDKLYDSILIYVPERNFSMAVEDQLLNDYRIDDEDLVDIANDLFVKRNGFKAKKIDIEKAEKHGATINTFEGILLFITPERYNY